MKIFTKIISLALIAGSAVFGILIIKDGRSSVVNQLSSRETAPHGDLADNSAIATPSPVIAIPPSVILSGAKESPRVENLPTGNATEKIAKDLAREFVNQENLASQLDIDPGKLATKILNNQLNNIDLSEFVPEIKLSELKIVRTNDKRVAENYLKNFQAILKNNFSKFDINFAKPTVEDFLALTKAYEGAISEFYKLVVPESLSEVHQQEIKLLTVQKNIFNNLSNYDKDPLKAFVSAQMAVEIDQQLADLQKTITIFISKNSLNI